MSEMEKSVPMSGSKSVLIVGGGIGGMALANGIQDCMQTSIFETRSDEKLQVGGCYVLWYAGVTAIQGLGMAEPLREIGNPVHHFEMCGSRGQVFYTVDVGSRGRELGAVPVAVRRTDLVAMLRRGLKPGVLQTTSAVRDLAETSGGVEATLTNGTVIEGDVGVGADGLSSTVRAGLHGLAPPRHPGYAHWFGIANDVDAPDHVFRIFHGDSSRFAFFRLDDGQVCWWCVRGVPESQRSDDSDFDRFGTRRSLLNLTARWHPIAHQLINKTPSGTIQRRDTLDRPPLRKWGRGRITLLGDAAHAMTFDLGQGAGTALTDARVLAAKLKQPGPINKKLREYETERSRTVTPLVRASKTIGDSAAWRGPGKLANEWFLRIVGPRVAPALLERDYFGSQVQASTE